MLLINNTSITSDFYSEKKLKLKLSSQIRILGVVKKTK